MCLVGLVQSSKLGPSPQGFSDKSRVKPAKQPFLDQVCSPDTRKPLGSLLCPGDFAPALKGGLREVVTRLAGMVY